MAGNFAKIDHRHRLRLLRGRVSQLHVWPKRGGRGAGRRFGTIEEGEKRGKRKGREGETVLSEFGVVGRQGGRWDTPIVQSKGRRGSRQRFSARNRSRLRWFAPYLTSSRTCGEIFDSRLIPEEKGEISVFWSSGLLAPAGSVRRLHTQIHTRHSEVVSASGDGASAWAGAASDRRPETQIWTSNLAHESRTHDRTAAAAAQFLAAAVPVASGEPSPSPQPKR